LFNLKKSGSVSINQLTILTDKMGIDKISLIIRII